MKELVPLLLLLLNIHNEGVQICVLVASRKLFKALWEYMHVGQTPGHQLDLVVAITGIPQKIPEGTGSIGECTCSVPELRLQQHGEC